MNTTITLSSGKTITTNEIREGLNKLARYERAEIATDELIRVLNVLGGEDEIADTVARVLMGSHRTLQQSFVRAFYEVMKDYSASGTDLRNQASVDFAKKITEQDFYFPMV